MIVCTVTAYIKTMSKMKIDYCLDRKPEYNPSPMCATFYRAFFYDCNPFTFSLHTHYTYVSKIMDLTENIVFEMAFCKFYYQPPFLPP